MKSFRESYLFYISFLIPFLWILGVHVSDVSRTIACLSAFALAWKLFSRKKFNSFQLPHWTPTFGIIFGLCYCLLILAYMISNVYSGGQTIDFAIFTQVIDSISRWGNFRSTLIGTENHNFLVHHFSPFLAIPGVLGFLGVPAYISGPIVHSFCLASCYIGFIKLSRALGFSKEASYLPPLFLFFIPSFRHTVVGGIHLETFSMAFLPWIFLAWKEKRIYTVFILSILSFTTKESLFLIIGMFSLLALIEKRINHEGEKLKNSQFIYGFLLLISFSSFFSYFFLQPLLFEKNFDHMNKVASLGSLLDPESLYKKGIWLLYLFLPFLYYPLWRSKNWIYLLPALPSIGIVLISNFSEMPKLNNYYAATPTLLILIASLFSLHRNHKKISSINPTLLLLLFSLSFSFSSRKPLKVLKNNLKHNLHSYSPSEIDKVPKNKNLVVSSSAALFLLDSQHLLRLWDANRRNVDYDYLVLKKSEEGQLMSRTVKNAKKCFIGKTWVIWCNKGRKLEKGQWISEYLFNQARKN